MLNFNPYQILNVSLKIIIQCKIGTRLSIIIKIQLKFEILIRS